METLKWKQDQGEKKTKHICLTQWRIRTSKSILLTGVVQADVVKKVTGQKDQGRLFKALLLYTSGKNN